MYLNYSSVYYNDRLHAFSNGVRAFFEPATYAKVKSGLAYPVLELAKKVQIEGLPVCHKPTAFILAGGNAHFAGTRSKEAILSELDYDYKIQAKTLTQIIAHQEAKHYDNVQRISVDHSACASSLFVLEEAKYLLEHRGFGRVIVLAVEDAVCGMSMNFFAHAGVQPTPRVSAFDTKNFGFHLGQGAVTAVFEAHRTDTSIAQVLDVNSASEEHSNSLGMREDGQGYIRAMEGCDLTRVSIVKTHGTGTPINNLAEKTALCRMLPSHFVATSLKPSIGHTLGASGLLESVMLIEAIRLTGQVPCIPNRTTYDDVFLSEDRNVRGSVMLALAAGMGNIYTAAVWKIL